MKTSQMSKSPNAASGFNVSPLVIKESATRWPIPSSCGIHNQNINPRIRRPRRPHTTHFSLLSKFQQRLRFSNHRPPCTQHHTHVLLEGRLGKVAIGQVRARQQLLEVVCESICDFITVTLLDELEQSQDPPPSLLFLY